MRSLEVESVLKSIVKNDMKTYMIAIIVNFILINSVMSDSEMLIAEIIKVDFITADSDFYPFLKTNTLEREGNTLKVELQSDDEHANSVPLVLLPEGIVCIKKNKVNFQHSLNLSWIHDMFDDPQEDDNNLLELSKIAGDFIISFTDFNVLISFFQRSDEALFMTATKLQMSLEYNNHTYFIGSFPSSANNTSWRRTNDERVLLMVDTLLSLTPQHNKPENLPSRIKSIND